MKLFFLNEDLNDDNSIYLNESFKKTAILSLILSLPLLLLGSGVAYFSIKDFILDQKNKENIRIMLGSLIRNNKNVKQLSDEISSIKLVSFKQLCDNLNYKIESRANLLKDEDITIRAIFNKNGKIISYGILYSIKEKSLLFYGIDKKFNKEQTIFIKSLLEYHFKIKKDGIKELEKMIMKNKGKLDKNSNLLNRDKNKKVPNITKEDLEEMEMEFKKIVKLLFNELKKLKYYKNIYSKNSSEEELLKQFKDFKNYLLSNKVSNNYYSCNLLDGDFIIDMCCQGKENSFDEFYNNHKNIINDYNYDRNFLKSIYGNRKILEEITKELRKLDEKLGKYQFKNFILELEIIDDAVRFNIDGKKKTLRLE